MCRYKTSNTGENLQAKVDHELYLHKTTDSIRIVLYHIKIDIPDYTLK